MKPALYINASGEQVMSLLVFKQADPGQVWKAVRTPYPKRRKVPRGKR